jgi:hypothetical protein
MRFRVFHLLLFATIASAQVNHGELQLKIIDPTGARIRALVHLTSAGNDYDESFRSDASGSLIIQRIPFGSYTLQVDRPGFAPISKLIEIRSTVPIEQQIHLELASVHTDVEVTGTSTLINPFSSSSAMQIGSKQVEQRLSSLPGRSVQDLVISQPGWIYEGNAVLHPRGSEYQTQFVVDGIPMTDSRSPSFGPEIEADNLDSISIYTAGFPAEYGRKLGGVVELDTRRENKTGLHGDLVLSGGSYDTGSGYGDLQFTRGKDTLGATASGGMTSHYLNPVVPENYTNEGTTGDFSARYERDLAGSDRLILSVRHELSRYLIPNERIQEQAGQVQNGDNFETMGTASYQHLASPDGLLAIAGMVRDNSNDLLSNQHPTPIAAFLHNQFREGYLKASYSLHDGPQEFKIGVDADTTFLHQNFRYSITDPDQFDPDTPPSLSFAEQRPDLEQSAYLEDVIHVSNWTISAGLRWDHYQLLLNRNALSPRLSAGRYLPSARMVIHASYDRIFLTPYFENILISGSPQIDALSSQFLRLPVQPSQGNYYEVGITKSIFERMRLDVNAYRRNVENFADDDQLLNTGVSYPIAFNRAAIYGAEGKLEVIHLQKLTGFASYSYMLGNVWFPVTGGLFLGDSVSSATSQVSGHVPVSQDQRNTLWTRFRYSFTPNLWFAAGSSYGSGLPFAYDGTEAEALSEYGPDVISRINFARGRVRPQLSADASLGMTVCECGHVRMDLQADGNNLNNRLNVIDFNGLFSGNAIGPGRSFALRLNTRF